MLKQGQDNLMLCQQACWHLLSSSNKTWCSNVEPGTDKPLMPLRMCICLARIVWKLWIPNSKCFSTALIREFILECLQFSSQACQAGQHKSDDCPHSVMASALRNPLRWHPCFSPGQEVLNVILMWMIPGHPISLARLAGNTDVHVDWLKLGQANQLSSIQFHIHV